MRYDLPLDEPPAICRRWGIRELRLFGSARRDDFDAASDLDLIVDVAPGRTPGLDLYDLLAELERAVGRDVDLMTKAKVGIERSRDSAFREEVLCTAQTDYASA